MIELRYAFVRRRYMQKSKFYLSMIIKALIIAIGISGIVATVNMGSFMLSYTAFLYYTIQSNIFVVVIAAIFMALHILEFRGKKVINNGWLIAKFSLTVAITITFLVFFILLAPTLPVSYLLSFDNFSVHLIVPLLAIADFFLFDYKADVKGAKFLFGLAMPLYYLIFSLILSAFTVSFHGERVPYFFLNYDKLGWLWEKGQMGVAFWIIILCVCFTLLSYLFALGVKLRNKNNKN